MGRLGDICSIARGGSPRPIQSFLTDAADGINWIKISDATASGKYIYGTAEKIKPAGATRSRIVNDGDFLLSNSMSFGRPYIMRTTGCIHDGWLVLSRYEDSFDQDFLYHLLGSPQVFGQFDRLAAGSTVRNLNIDLASQVVVPIPPADEQRRIVAILEEAFEGIATAKANAEKNLQNAGAVFESYLQDVFTARAGHLASERLERLCDKRRPITYGVIKLGDPVEGGVPCLRTSNVRWLDIDTTGMKRIAPTLAAEYSRTILRGGEVLVNVRGTLGGVAVVPSHMVGWNVSREVAVVPVDADVLDPEYAAFWIGSRSSQDWLAGVKKGAAYTGINIEDLRNLPVPMLALEAQRAVVHDVLAIRDATLRMEEGYVGKLAALDELKKSLLHQAFTGAL
jgi:type I restriction enzyme, S subunit